MRLTPCTNRRRVLIVEDCPDSAYVLGVLLARLDCTVRVVCDSAKALRVAKDFRPDVALVDLGMPTVDGYQLAEAFRHHNDFARMRLIALTGYADEGHKEHAREIGFDDYIVKPYAVDVLQAALEHV